METTIKDPKELKAEQLVKVKLKVKELLEDTVTGIRPGRGRYIIRAIGVYSAFNMLNAKPDEVAYQIFQVVGKGIGCTDGLYEVGEMCKVNLRRENQLWVLSNNIDYYSVREGLRKNPSPISLIDSTRGKTQLEINIATADPCVFQEFYLVPEHEIEAIYEDRESLLNVVSIKDATNEDKFLNK